MKVREDQNRATVETDASVGNDAKQETPEPDAAGRVKPWTSEAGIDSGQALEQESLDRMRVATPNDPKLSDTRRGRAACFCSPTRFMRATRFLRSGSPSVPRGRRRARGACR